MESGPTERCAAAQPQRRGARASRDGKGEAAAPQRRRAAALAAAVFAVAEQRMAARGELAADLVKASRAQRDAHEGGGRAVECVGLQHAIVEQGLLDAAAGRTNCKGFLLYRILEEQIAHLARVGRGDTGANGKIRLFQGFFLHLTAQLGRGAGRPRPDHHAADSTV